MGQPPLGRRSLSTWTGRSIAVRLGTLDILARDRSTGDYVVIELKRDQGDDRVVGQVSRYMGWIKQHGQITRGSAFGDHRCPRGDRASSFGGLAASEHRLYTYQFAVTLHHSSYG